MSRVIRLLLALTVVSLTGCDFRTRTVSLSDARLAPMLEAMAAGDRAALGFTSIPTNAVVYLNDSSPSARSDADILIFNTPELYNDIHRNIEFRKTATGYKWIREFEYHPGPKTFKRGGHTAHECILISYDTDGMSGLAPDKLDVRYTGPDYQLAIRRGLTLDEVRPILAEWSQKH